MTLQSIFSVHGVVHLVPMMTKLSKSESHANGKINSREMGVHFKSAHMQSPSSHVAEH